MKYLLILFLLTGCVSVKYNAETHDFSYFRIGNQKMENLEIVKEPDIAVSLGKQEADNQQIIKLLNQILERMP